jgi:DNA-directed RNA polymerase III subunit RPC1
MLFLALVCPDEVFNVHCCSIPEGFVDRTLPHFDIKAREPAAKGFVSNSFFSGLTPTEFFFHTMGGREGLIDTAVKTAETGYMQRRLMKALEDLAVQYDNTVRVSTGTVVQFTYGDDGVEPTVTEAKDTPVDLLTLWNGIQKKYPFNLQPGDSYPLQPRQLIALVEQELLKDELFYNRPLGKPMKIREVAFKFFDDMRKELIMLRGTMGVSEDSDVLGELPPLAGPDGEVRRNWTLLQRENAVATITHATKIQIAEFFKKFTFKLRIAHAEPGTAVGALAGQSIGEPCTQMTLKTFHFAGVASMNITQGVPRIREIINASKKISTPIVEVELANTRDPILAQRVRSQLERTSLADVAAYVREEYHKDSGYILVKLDDDRIQRLMLDLDANAVKVRLLAARKLKLLESDVQVCGKRGNKLMIFAPKKFFSTARTKDRVQNTYITLQALKLALVNVTVAGFDTVKRCVIREKDAEYTVFVEGHELAGAMSVQGVVSKNIKANHILDVCGTLGIEAARRSIIDEIQDTMEHHGVGVDPRHLYLLADCMTYTGSVLGITRFGISKMRDSVLNLASFERTTDYLFDAGVYAKSDTISGVSECIIMGRPVPLGTSLCQVLHKPEYSHRGASYLPKVTLFEKHAGSQ